MSRKALPPEQPDSDVIYEDCIVLAGDQLRPHWCPRFAVEDGRVGALELGEPVQRIENGALLIMPAMVNAHTHVGDGFLPDGATGMTLEEGFFRPHGFKYRELAKLDRATHIDHITQMLDHMARTGTVAHFDFREQGAEGARRLREASERTGVRSVIFGQFDSVPFDAARLEANTDGFDASAFAELREVLEIADGFSESTMNDLTDTAWAEVRELTESEDKARAIHCLENAGYREVSVARTGRGDLERAFDLYAPDLVVHLTVADSREIAMLAQSGCTAVLNPRANANLGLPLPPVGDLLHAGVNLLLGTDNGLLNSPDLFAELDFTYKLAKSQMGNAIDPAPETILRMVTRNVRETRWGGELPGVLEVGAPANFTVVDFHAPHLRRSGNVTASLLTRVTQGDVVRTVRAGTPVYERQC